jgi:serine/threonine protein kinase
MGRVYKATQLSLGRVVALKVVRSSLIKNVTALKRFQREVKAAAAAILVALPPVTQPPQAKPTTMVATAPAAAAQTSEPLLGR